MQDLVVNLFFKLIQRELNPDKQNKELFPMTAEDIEALYRLSSRHDLAHIIADALAKRNLLTGVVGEKFSEQQIFAVLRYERINFDYQKICVVLNDEKIPYIPLKGMVVRTLYPEEWMRTSCDIDILVRESDLDHTISCLKNKGFRQEGKKNFHDVSLISPSNVHLELHFNILENIENIDFELSKVWDYASPITDGSCEYKLSNEFFIFHTVAHMLYHFKTGGCGVRPFIDLYLIKKNFEIDEEKLLLLLDNCKIKKFYDCMLKVSEVWFEDKSDDEIVSRIQKYVLDGGVYGNFENQMAINKSGEIKKSRYVFRRIFAPLIIMKAKYPTLRKHAWLLPFFWVRRWFETLFNGKIGKLRKEMDAFDDISEERNREIKQLREDLEI